MAAIAVIILNWNGIGFMKKFIPGVIRSCDFLGNASDGWQARTVIADNGSDDGSVEWMHSLGNDADCIFFDKNYGFTGGYNKAIGMLKDKGYDYYLLLNSDIEVTEDWLLPLAEWMESHPECGIASPKLRSYSDREYFEYAGAAGGFIDRWGFPFCRGRIMSAIEKDSGQYDAPCEIFWATGAAMLIRASLYHECGGLDETFFAHMEEIDLCWRAKLLGTQVWNVPGSVVYHVGGGALPNNSPRKLYLNFRNNLLMLYKNLPARGRGAFIFFRMMLDGAAGAVFLIRGQKEYFKAVIQAHNSFREMKKTASMSPRIEERSRGRLKGMWKWSILLPHPDPKNYFRE